MLRVGLTGDLGSGKSTVAAELAKRGAVLFSSDAIATRTMQPGEAVYAQIVNNFGLSVVCADGALDRGALAREAFERGRVEELNDIVHPAVLQEQQRLLEDVASVRPHAIAVVESALIFSTRHGIGTQPWRTRFDCIVLVRAPLELKVARYVSRLTSRPDVPRAEPEALASDARARLALQSVVNEAHASECLLIDNDGDFASLERQVNLLWPKLQRAEASTR